MLSECGIIVGMSLLCLGGFIIAVSQYLLYESFVFCSEQFPIGKINDYEQLGSYYYGSIMSIILQICLCIRTFGTCVLFVAIVGDIIKMISWTPFMKYHSLSLFIIFIPFITLSMSKRVANMRFLSYISIFSTLVFLILVIIFYFFGNKKFKVSSNVLMLPDFSINKIIKFISVMGMIFFSYDSSTIICNVSSEYKQKSRYKVGISIFISCCVMFWLFSITAGFGYLSFKTQIKSNLIKNYENSSWSEVVLIIFLSISITFTYPLLLFPCRYTFQNILKDFIKFIKRNKKIKSIFSSTSKKVKKIISKRMIENIFVPVITLIIGLLSYAVAIFYPKPANVFNLLGSTIGIFLCIIIPCLFFLKSVVIRKSKFYYPKSLFVIFLLLFSVIIGFFTSMTSILALFKSN